MRFALNRYDINFRVIVADGPPIPGAKLEVHPFGLPPFERRDIWMIEVRNLDHVCELAQHLGTQLNISESSYWSGTTLSEPGNRLFGISVIDDPSAEIDPRDKPIRVVEEVC